LTGASPPIVAVYYAGSTVDLSTKLTATGAFTSVTAVNVNAATPTVAQMKAYDAVVVWTFVSVTTAFGDNLADYFEQGGGVVIADYESQETGTSWGLKGRYATQYTMSTPITSASWLTTKVTLGTVNEPMNPLMNQVSTFALQGTSPYHMPTSAFNLNNPIIVALFSDNTPAVVRSVVASGPAAGRNLVEINSFGLSVTGSSSYGWDITPDGAKLFRNALLYTIPPPALTAAQQVSFGTQPLYTPTAPQAVTYTNTSSSPQTITALSLPGTHIGEFSVSPSSPLPYTIPAGGTFIVNVTFNPAGVGLRAATLGATVQGISGKLTTLLSGTGI